MLKRSFTFHNRRRGFTLIELIVAIGIIGILTTVVAANLQGAKAKTRDTKRLADLRELHTALELYNSQNNNYPAGAVVALGIGDYSCLNKTGWQKPSCAEPYLLRVPLDPQGVFYVYTATPDSYTVVATLEGTLEGLSDKIELTPAGFRKSQ